MMPGANETHSGRRVLLDSQALRIEGLRQNFQLYSSLAGNLVDLLDRGHPTPDQARAAQADLANHEHAEARALRALSGYLADLRVAAPQVVREWADSHITICKRILNESEPARLRTGLALGPAGAPVPDPQDAGGLAQGPAR